MEKIYMEENKKQSKSVMNLSVVLSFVVSIFAVFSLAMFGIVMNQGTGVSYAAPDGTDFNITLGKTITSYTKNNGTIDKEYEMTNYYAGTAGVLQNQVFCIERHRDIKEDGNDTYKATATVRSGKTDISKDQGLIYLLGLGQAKKPITGYGDVVDGYVLQSAIWYYLADKYNDDVYQLYDEESSSHQQLRDKAVMEHDGTIYLKIDGQEKDYSDLSGTNGYILSLVKAAREYSGNQFAVSIGEAKPAKTEDGKYYQSAVITPVGTETFVTFDVEVSGIEGAIIVNENGQEIASTNIPAGTKFYVRIPAEKVSKESQTVKVNVRGVFTNGSAAYYYSTTDDATYQRLAYVAPTADNKGVEFAVVGDTGMNVAQTIYFIGLIVLLCGVGIVYANAKPVEAKQ